MLHQVSGAQSGAKRRSTLVTIPVLNMILVMPGFFSTENRRWSGALRAGSKKAKNKSCPECSHDIHTVTAFVALVTSGAFTML